LGLYNLIKEINSKTRHLTGGEITVYSDNKCIINEVMAPVEKESVFTKEAGATIAAIKEEITKSTIEIYIEYSNNKPRDGRAFQ